MTNNETVLMSVMLPASSSTDWEIAKTEWILDHISMLKGSTCTCGHYPITDRCHLVNTITKSAVIVGNCCVTKFFTEIKSDGLFRGIKGIMDNIYNSSSKDLFYYAFTNKILTEWEYKFSVDTQRKRALTPKQYAVIMKVNIKILKAFGIEQSVIDKACTKQPIRDVKQKKQRVTYYN